MFTTRGVPALDDTDALALVGEYSRDLQTYLYGDSGWQACTLEPGIVVSGSGNPEVRRIGQIIYFRGAVTNATMSSSANHTIGTVPTGFRPPAWSYFVVASNTIAANGRIVITSAGAVQVLTSTTLGTYYAWNLSWPIN